MLESLGEVFDEIIGGGEVDEEENDGGVEIMEGGEWFW